MTTGLETWARRRALTLICGGVLGLLGWILTLSGRVPWAALLGWLSSSAVWILTFLVFLVLTCAGGWIWARPSLGRRNLARSSHTQSRPPLSWWAVAGALFVVVGVAWAATTWLLHEAAFAKDVAATRVDAIKTGLSIAAGTGGVFALLLAVRRQWHQEVSASDTVLDATERRVTELYTKAVEQLGSEKAPVRLGGMYALERLAQANPTQRQTVVNVLCAYLRMPYRHLKGVASTVEETGPAGGWTSPPNIPGPDDTTWEERTLERQVRLTAQRILIHHMRPAPSGYKPAEPAETFWPNSDVDLTGALLIDFDMSRCVARTVTFDRACFVGGARFENVQFTGQVGFQGAKFAEFVQFLGTDFESFAGFRDAEFDGEAVFWMARFSGDADFEGVRFAGLASFAQAEFGGDASFMRARFRGGAPFSGAIFTKVADFEGVDFSEDADFKETTFGGRVTYSGGRFAKCAVFSRASFVKDAVFDRATFGCAARFERSAFGEDATFNGAGFIGQAVFDYAAFTGQSSFAQAKFTRLANFREVVFSGSSSLADARFHVHCRGAPGGGEALDHSPSSG